VGVARPLKVGILWNARRSQGGLYQYATTLVAALGAHERQHRYTLFNAWFDPLPFPVPDGWRVFELPREQLALRLAGEAALLGLARLGNLLPLPVVPPYRSIAVDPPEVMLYVKPTVHSFLWPYPAVVPVHDLQHLLQPRFPEVSAHGEKQRREFVYQNALPRAAAVLTDSEVGREEVLAAYPLDPDRVHSLPYLPAPTAMVSPGPADLRRVRECYRPQDGFLFYPAAFWPHKNHRTVLQALAILAESHGMRPPLLLAGNRKGDFRTVLSLSSRLGLHAQVRFLGYVPDEDMAALYRLALCLVMPTFFGPTNIPVLEAWAQGCPVITSDLRGIREQVGDAACLVDPSDTRALAEAIRKMIIDSDWRRQLAERGRARLARWTPADFARKLAHILTAAVRPPERHRHPAP
jgi:glycosyltransferase involved in cell wall biosynthesis